jgi:hypothetical protein
MRMMASLNVFFQTIDRSTLRQRRPPPTRLQEYVKPAFCISGRTIPVAVSRPFPASRDVQERADPVFWSGAMLLGGGAVNASS